MNTLLHTCGPNKNVTEIFPREGVDCVTYIGWPDCHYMLLPNEAAWSRPLVKSLLQTATHQLLTYLVFLFCQRYATTPPSPSLCVFSGGAGPRRAHFRRARGVGGGLLRPADVGGRRRHVRDGGGHAEQIQQLHHPAEGRHRRRLLCR